VRQLRDEGKISSESMRIGKIVDVDHHAIAGERGISDGARASSRGRFVALLERAFFLDGTFHLHSEKGKPHWWSGAMVDVVEVSAARLVSFPYTQVFTSKGAHWGRAVLLSFLAWPLGFLVRRSCGKVVRGVSGGGYQKAGFLSSLSPLVPSSAGAVGLQFGSAVTPSWK